MIRFLLILVLCTGCQSTAPEALDYQPTVAVAIGVAEATPDGTAPTPDTPDDGDCKTCGGKGWLGDGQPRADCPDCHTKWDDHAFAAPTKDSPSPSNVPADTKQDADGIAPVEPAAGTGDGETNSIDGGRRDEQRRNIAERVPSSADQSDWQPLTWDRYRDARLPTLVYFSGKTCGPCHVFERGVLAPCLPAIADGFALLRDDSFGASEFADEKHFDVIHVPTLFVVYQTQQGKRMLRLVGRTLPNTPQDLLDVLQPYFNPQEKQ